MTDAIKPELPPLPVAFDREGFRAFVLRELPDNTIIGKGEWWADHLSKWAERFACPSSDAAAAAVAAERERCALLKADALGIFNGPETSQDVRDVIEWYDAAIRATAPKEPT